MNFCEIYQFNIRETDMHAMGIQSKCWGKEKKKKKARAESIGPYLSVKAQTFTGEIKHKIRALLELNQSIEFDAMLCH